MCAQCIRHPINGSVFTLLLSAFFGFWVGVVEIMTGKLLVLVKSQVYEPLCFFSAAWRRALCIFLSCQLTKWLFSFKYHSHYISSTYPLDQLLFALWDSVTCFCSPALNAGHGFIHPLNKLSFLSFQMWHIQLKYTQPFHFIVWFAELWLYLKVMPQVRSHCVCCASFLWQPQCETDVSEGRHVCSL